MLPVQALIFDIDGTLIDSNDAHATAWAQVFTEASLAVSYEAVRCAIGMGGDHLLPKLTGVAADSRLGKKMEARRGDIFRADFLPTLRAFSRARDLIELLKAKGYACAIATSASQKDLRALLKQTHLDGLFDQQTNAADVSNSKPNPDVVEAALASVDVDARRAIMVGDTPYDIEAARRAGVRTIAVMSGGWTRESLIQAGAWKVYSDPEDLFRALEKNELFIDAPRSVVSV